MSRERDDSMLVEQRQRRIVELLMARGAVRSSELTEVLGVSRETVRRDLYELESRGLLRRVYGGAAPQSGAEPPYAHREVSFVRQKEAIGRATAALVADGETVFIDLGTTTLEVARRLRGKRNLTVLTNSVPIALELVNAADIRVFLTGGALRPGDLSLSGPIARQTLAMHYVDRAILGAGGLTVKAGLTDYHLDEAEGRRQMIEHARQVTVVADSSKFGVTAFARIAEATDIDLIVTSWDLPAQVAEAFRDVGTEVLIAPENEDK